MATPFRTLDLAVEFHALVKRERVPDYLRYQLLRSSASVALNLAEGNGKFSFKEKAHIYQIAMGSLRESQTALKLAEIENPKLTRVGNELGGCLYRLIKAAEARGQVKK